MAQAFEILEHPADVGFRAWGGSITELFENAALALFFLGCDDLAFVQEAQSRVVDAAATDREALLYAWLAELLAVSEAERLIFRRALISEMSETRLHATVYGEPLDRDRHHSGTHIKAVTFHQLFVKQTYDGWSAQVFLDL
jgi:SHS2 domain-containing protein